MERSRTGTLDPAPPQPRQGGGGGRWSWLLTATGLVEAELVRGVLESAGLPVVLDRTDSSPFAWMYLGGNVNAPVRVFVPSGLLDAARLHLLDAGFDSRLEPDRTPAQEPDQSVLWRIMRMTLTVAVLAAAAYVVIVTFLGSATCALRLFC
ncbi:MAG: DUF2007 domain-containing protein [Actinobacteria bacterium]|nr:DUF2007 domain-containing protein [Actinomycetota bacterium]